MSLLKISLKLILSLTDPLLISMYSFLSFIYHHECHDFGNLKIKLEIAELCAIKNEPSSLYSYSAYM